MRMLRTGMSAMATTALLFGATMVPAEAANNRTNQDGLVNVNVGDVTVLEDVNVAVVAEVLANVCDVADVGNVTAAVLGQATATDRSGRDSRTVCTADAAPVSFTQN